MLSTKQVGGIVHSTLNQHIIPMVTGFALIKATW